MLRIKFCAHILDQTVRYQWYCTTNIKVMGSCMVTVECTVLCKKNVIDSGNFELSLLKKKKKEEEDNILVTCRFVRCLFVPVYRSLIVHENNEDKWYVVIKAYKFLRF